MADRRPLLPYLPGFTERVQAELARYLEAARTNGTILLAVTLRARELLESSAPFEPLETSDVYAVLQALEEQCAGEKDPHDGNS